MGNRTYQIEIGASAPFFFILFFISFYFLYINPIVRGVIARLQTEIRSWFNVKLQLSNYLVTNLTQHVVF